MKISKAESNFLFHCRYEKNLSPKTLKAYSIDLRQFREFLAGDLGLSDLERVDKTALRAYIQRLFEGLAVKSVKRKVATLKALFNFLEREDEIPLNPFRKMEVRIKETRRLPRAVGLADLQRLFRHVYALKREAGGGDETPTYRAVVRDVAVLELLFSTAARVSEACGLDTGDVDLRSGKVRILGKGRAERVVPIAAKETAASLREYTALWSPEPGGPFFLNRPGGRLSTQSVRTMLHKHAARAGLPGRITPHCIRHSVATLLLKEGVALSYIQDLLGHSSVVTTQIYAQVDRGEGFRLIARRHPRGRMSGAE